MEEEGWIEYKNCKQGDQPCAKLWREKGMNPRENGKTTTWTRTACYGESSRLGDVPGSGAPVEEKQTAVGAAKALVPSWGKGSEYYLLETGVINEFNGGSVV